MFTVAKDRRNTGLHGVFKTVFPISDFSETSTLEYVRYEFDRRNTTSTSAASAASTSPPRCA